MTEKESNNDENGLCGIDISDPLYNNYFVKERETWSEDYCKKLSNATKTDGLGTKYHFKGYVGDIIPEVIKHYNGGTVINDKWYQGIITPRPIIPKDYELVSVVSWGLRLVKK